MITPESRDKFNSLFIRARMFDGWRHRTTEPADNSAWRFYGEFGVPAEMAFEKHLKEIYEHKTAKI